MYAPGTDGLHPPSLELKGRYFRGDRSAGFEFLLIMIGRYGERFSITSLGNTGGKRATAQFSRSLAYWSDPLQSSFTRRS